MIPPLPLQEFDDSWEFRELEEFTSTAMGIVMTASGLTLTILLEVIGEDTTIEDGFDPFPVLQPTVELQDCWLEFWLPVPPAEPEVVAVVATDEEDWCRRITGRLEVVMILLLLQFGLWPRFIFDEDEQ